MSNYAINLENLKQHINVLAGDIAERNIRCPESLQAAANYISDQWRNVGYDVSNQTFSAHDHTCHNLEITLLGSKRPDKIILMGAHYDSAKGSPGANDATGIAALLEIARCIHAVRPKHTIRFVAFANEVPPFLNTSHMGTWAYAHQARRNNDDIHTAIILKSIGYYSNLPDSQLSPPLLRLFCPKRGNFIAMASNLGSWNRLYRFSRGFRRHSKFPFRRQIAISGIPGMQWDNQSAFWLHDYRAFTLSDTGNFRYPFYCSSRDTPDKIHLQGLTHVTDAILKALLTLDQKG